ncbi:MAG: group II truncated hemoglobin [bacterium]
MTTATLYDWIGGRVVLLALVTRFYDKVAQDPLIGPIFATMGPDHPAHVADFMAEVFGGPKLYSTAHGGHPAMIRHHLNRHLTEPQRRRWVSLLLDSYAESAAPQDPEFAQALVSYLEWGSRLAVINSQDGTKVSEDAPMPEWGWGVVGGPYQPKD